MKNLLSRSNMCFLHIIKCCWLILYSWKSKFFISLGGLEHVLVFWEQAVSVNYVLSDCPPSVVCFPVSCSFAPSAFMPYWPSFKFSGEIMTVSMNNTWFTPLRKHISTFASRNACTMCYCFKTECRNLIGWIVAEKTHKDYRWLIRSS